MKKLMIIAALAALASGCETESVYVKSDTIIEGRADAMTMYDFDATTEALITAMRRDDGFMASYGEIKAELGKRPVVAVGPFKNRTDSRIQDRLESMRNKTRVSLRKTGLFRVKNDDSTDDTLARINESRMKGLENSALVQTMGEQDSPTLYVTGETRAFRDGKYYTYRVWLQMTNLLTGDEVWSDEKTVIKRQL